MGVLGAVEAHVRQMSRYGMLCKLSMTLLRLLTMVNMDSKSKFAFCRDFVSSWMALFIFIFFVARRFGLSNRAEPKEKKRRIRVLNLGKSKLCNASVDQLQM